ncbi:MAG: hypothetical protein AAFS10_25285, partial [Myxococcota bacterium]
MNSSTTHLVGLPFPEQIRAIASTIEQGRDLAALLMALGDQPDHEPLAFAVRTLGHTHQLDVPGVRDRLLVLLTTLPDTGIQRILRGVDRARWPVAQQTLLASVVSEALDQLDLDRLSAICLMDRW